MRASCAVKCPEMPRDGDNLGDRDKNSRLAAFIAPPPRFAHYLDAAEKNARHEIARSSKGEERRSNMFNAALASIERARQVLNAPAPDPDRLAFAVLEVCMHFSFEHFFTSIGVAQGKSRGRLRATAARKKSRDKRAERARRVVEQLNLPATMSTAGKAARLKEQDGFRRASERTLRRYLDET